MFFFMTLICYMIYIHRYFIHKVSIIIALNTLWRTMNIACGSLKLRKRPRKISQCVKVCLLQFVFSSWNHMVEMPFFSDNMLSSDWNVKKMFNHSLSLSLHDCVCVLSPSLSLTHSYMYTHTYTYSSTCTQLLKNNLRNYLLKF